MAEAPRKDRPGKTPGATTEPRPRGASAPGTEPRELDDTREDEGWSQPESSAQKGAQEDREEG